MIKINKWRRIKIIWEYIDMNKIYKKQLTNTRVMYWLHTCPHTHIHKHPHIYMNFIKTIETHIRHGISSTSSMNPKKRMKQIDVNAALYCTSHCIFHIHPHQKTILKKQNIYSANATPI